MKTTLKSLVLAATLGVAAPAAAQPYAPSASTEVYNLSGLGDKIIELFYKAEQQGRKYPTLAEFKQQGITEIDLAFVRSHVRKRNIMVDHSRDVNPNVTEGRNLFLNLPMGVGKSIGGYPSSNFSDDVFSMWNYAHLWGTWNHGLFSAPAGWVDAGHRNGTDVMTGIKFFESWGTTSDAWNAMISTKNTDGTYRYARSVVNALMYFGHDGINYNFEDQGYTEDDVIGFHKALWREAEAAGMQNFHVMMYTQSQSLTDTYAEAMWGTKETGRTTELMLNYNNGNFTSPMAMNSSYTTATNKLGTADGLYAGVWIADMNRNWKYLSGSGNASKIGVALWGEHGQSRFFSYNTGNNAFEFQSRYQKLLERGFAGGYRNPALRPTETTTGIEWEGTKPLSAFQGLAEYFPERSAIQGNLPFINYFCLGNGERYNYRGIKTLGNWYNMSAQDIVPTYRWWATQQNSTTATLDVLPEYTHEDSYIGGSCLRLVGKTSGGVDINIFRTSLRATTGNVVARVAVKTGKTGNNASNLAVIVRKKGDTQWKAYPVGDINGEKWVEKSLALDGISAGDVIESLGIRALGDVDGLLLGELSVLDEAKVAPAPVQNVIAEVKEETQGSMSVKLAWTVGLTGGERAEYGMIFNDEANIDHFELLYKNGEDGRVSEVGRTQSWAGLVPGIQLAEGDKPFVGVRAASVDGRSHSEVVWVEIPRADASQLPEVQTQEGSYPKIGLNIEAEGAANALAQRFVSELSTTGATQNLNYTANAPAGNNDNYVFAKDYVLKVEQGQTVTLNFKVNYLSNGDDGLRFCMARAYMDYDADYNFDGAGDELIYIDYDANEIRKSSYDAYVSGITKTFTVPTDAAPGQSRLRLVFSDSWFPHPGPSGLTQKGFSIDFPVVISGSNAGRKPASDTHDQGEAPEPDNLDGKDNPQPGEGISAPETVQCVSHASLVGQTLTFEATDEAWVYDAAGSLVAYIPNTTLGASTATYAPGTYIVKMRRANVVRAAKFVVK